MANKFCEVRKVTAQATTKLATIYDDNTVVFEAVLDGNPATKSVVSDIVAFGVPGLVRTDGSYSRQKANDGGVVKASYAALVNTQLALLGLAAVAV